VEEKNMEDYAKSNYTNQHINNYCFIKFFFIKTQMDKILVKGKRVQCKKDINIKNKK